MSKKGFATLLLALAAMSSHAENYLSPTDERVRLSIGFMHVTNDTNLQVDSSQNAPGTRVQGEDEFRLDKSDFEPKFQAVVRVGERHRLRFDYFTLDRTGNATVATPIQFRDVLLIPGDPVQTNLALRTLGIAYEYSFVHTQRFEAAGVIGINITDISARARVTTQMRHVNQTEDQAGPLPTLGVDATFVISKRFYVDARAQYMKASVDHFDGSLGFYELDVLYRLRPNIAFAVGYNLVKASLQSTKSSQSGFFDFSSKGPQAFVRVAF